MNLSPTENLLLGWSLLASAWVFVLFGFDKVRSRQGGARRISEATLCWMSALGGWPGGLIGLSLFRHKSAKASFLLKFALAFFVWSALLLGAVKLTGRW